MSVYNVNNAEAVIPGYDYVAAEGLYCAHTQAIAPKDLGDTYWFAVYAKLSDGSYSYSKLVSYSPSTYAYNQLSDPSMNKLMVAMLNYGAAAQSYFNYKTSTLVNRNLTTAQKGMIQSYNASMMDAVVAANAKKVGIFANSGGFSRRYPSVIFEGAFSISYCFTPSNVPSGNVTMYYWTQDVYNSVSTLTPANASGKIVMVKNSSGVYEATVDGIAAKDLDRTVYVAGGYMSGGNSYCTGVLAYSIGGYCVSQASIAGDLQPLAAATAVYGYYAKQLFH